MYVVQCLMYMMDYVDDSNVLLIQQYKPVSFDLPSP